jgi:hypothetical protein
MRAVPFHLLSFFNSSLLISFNAFDTSTFMSPCIKSSGSVVSLFLSTDSTQSFTIVGSAFLKKLRRLILSGVVDLSKAASIKRKIISFILSFSL